MAGRTSARSEMFSHWHGGSLHIEDMALSTGGRIFVHSGTGYDTTGYGLTPDAPCATLNRAVALATASKFDLIILMPGHAETISTALLSPTLSKIGLRVVGLGRGSLRPTFTFTHVDATFAVSAASVSVENVRFTAGVSAVKVGITVTATDFEMRNCEMYWGGTTTWDFILGVSLLTASRAIIEKCRFLAEPAVAGAASAVYLSSANHNVIVKDNEFMGDYSVACLNGVTVISQGLMFLDNLVHNTDAGEPYLEVFSGTTGVIAGTRGLASAATIAANAVADAMAHIENYVANTTGTIAIIKGAGGSPALDAD